MADRNKLAREMTHARSYTTPITDKYGVELIPTLGENGKYYLREAALETPLLDPLDPFLLPKTLPALAGKGALNAMKGYGRLAAEAVARGVEGQGPLSGALAAIAPRNVVKNKGGNWLSGSVEDALRGLKQTGPLGNDVGNVGAINSWIDKNLARYVKNEMATPEDPVRALAERGVLHVDPGSLFYRNRQVHPSGNSLEKLAQTPDALSWENASDFAVMPESAGLFKKTLGQDGTTTLSRNPWLVNLPNDAVVHDLHGAFNPRDLGFPHLIDELSNAINPASGLPRNLQFPVDRLHKVSVAEAVQRVADINAHRAALKAEADAAKANNAATVLHKEYPENNPLGLRWVQLRAQDADHPMFLKEGVSPRDAVDARRQALADALKYEGDTMGHCVGGYCDDVLSGRARIFSLRDAKGQPHVTIETRKGGKYDPDDLHMGDVLNEDDAVADQTYRVLQEILEERGIQNAADLVETEAMGGRIPEEYRQIMRDAWGEVEGRIPQPVSSPGDLDRIVQIKGSGKKDPGQRLRLTGDAPDAHLLPFVQDFVRSGKWSDVGDLENTGLRKITEDRIRKELGDYVTEDEWAKYMKTVLPPDELASGGPVQKQTMTQADLKAIIATLSQGHSNAA